MITTGKKMRKSTGLTRHEIKFNEHTNKSNEKCKRAGWGKKGNRQAMKDGKLSKIN